MSADERRFDAVVVGGGLAGLAAALRLVERGLGVALLESRPRLGGATASFTRSGCSIDTGQHIALSCYQRYLSLLTRLGVADGVRRSRLDIPVIYGAGATARLRVSLGLPAPVHLGGCLAGYRALTATERCRAGLAALALRRLDPSDPRADHVSFADWLRRHHQSSAPIRRLWGLICVAALNAAPERASLALAIQVFRTALLDRADAADLVLPQLPLGELHGRSADRVLRADGVRVSTGTRVKAIEAESDGFRLSTPSDSFVTDRVVLAVPHRAAANLVPRSVCPDADRWNGLGASAIVNCHFQVDRRVLAEPFAALPDSECQWVFDRTRVGGLAPGAQQYLVTSVSDADRLVSRRSADLVRDQLEGLRYVLPRLRSAQVVDAFVTREPCATFAQRPGTAALRPPAATRHPGLALAGAWTATGWPDTMEGAVRSGEAAAEQVLGSEHLHRVSLGAAA